MTTPARGDRVGKYEILTPLTLGGMAELFIGSTVGPGGFQKHVVIKRILPDASRDENFMRMVLDEARITAGFSHPNIAQVYDLGEDEQGLYVVMEFIAGQNLNQVVSVCAKKQHVLPLGFSVSVINDCAQALHYAHTYVKPSGESYPVVHRDVAQKNIMVGWDGQTKLLDFGIAKAANTLSRTKVGTVKGTAGYMSPEQVTGKAVDGRSDVFSLGVVLWEMVTGQRLFAAETELAEMKLILEAKVERPDEVEPVVPSTIADIIMKAVAREPSDRWNSAKEMSKAISTRCPELLFDAEERSAFMRELFSDRIDQTRKLFELSKAKEGTSDQEVRQLAKSIQESAMSQPVLKPVKSKGERPKPAPGKKSKQRSSEDDKLLELAIRVDQVALGAEVHKPRRTYTGPLVFAVLVVLALATANKFVFPEKRVSSSGLVLWDGEPDDSSANADQPKPAPKLPIAVDAIPGAETTGDEDDDAPAGSSPVVLPAAGGGEAKTPAATPKPKNRVPPSGPAGDVTLALLPDGAKVFKGKEELGNGSMVSFSLPSGTHMLTIVGSDGVKRRLSVQVSPGKNKAQKFTVNDLPTQ
ncbi:MAG: serine/threonine protein kinase [Archangiaceae bacterium]|nr:serine/threonine protein kinase [Archangiaceae bacterium]